MDRLTVNLLEPHDEHRAVRFAQDGCANLDDVVGPDGEEEPIERGVMELAGDLATVNGPGARRWSPPSVGNRELPARAYAADQPHRIRYKPLRV
jgi:hypothetical protein